MTERAHPEDKNYVNSPYYHQFIERHRRANLFISDDSNVVDIPCGCGWGTSMLNGKCVLGMDINMPSIHYAWEHFTNDRIRFCYGDMRNIHIPPDFGTPTIFTCLDGIEHITFSEAVGFLERAKNLLAPNGFFIISTPQASKTGKIDNPFHKFEYMEQDLLRLLYGAGLVTVDGSIYDGVEGKILFFVGQRFDECGWLSPLQS